MVAAHTLFCMMVLMHCDRLAVSLGLSLALSVFKMKLSMLKYLVIHVVFFIKCLIVVWAVFSLFLLLSKSPVVY